MFDIILYVHIIQNRSWIALLATYYLTKGKQQYILKLNHYGMYAIFVCTVHIHILHHKRHFLSLHETISCSIFFWKNKITKYFRTIFGKREKIYKTQSKMWLWVEEQKVSFVVSCPAGFYKKKYPPRWSG